MHTSSGILVNVILVRVQKRSQKKKEMINDEHIQSRDMSSQVLSSLNCLRL